MTQTRELLDVIDEDDRVVGRADRAEMRARNLLHRAVYVLVLNGRGALFVHQRTVTKDVYPAYWDVTVGGVVAAGEDYATAAVRETREELGITNPEPRLLGPLRYEDHATRLRGAVFLTVHDGPTTLQADEIARGGFVTLAAAERVLAQERCCPDGALAFRTYRAALGPATRSR
jgi:isopentenyldiphosphate isomerase